MSFDAFLKSNKFETTVPSAGKKVNDFRSDIIKSLIKQKTKLEREGLPASIQGASFFSNAYENEDGEMVRDAAVRVKRSNRLYFGEHRQVIKCKDDAKDVISKIDAFIKLFEDTSIEDLTKKNGPMEMIYESQGKFLRYSNDEEV